MKDLNQWRGLADPNFTDNGPPKIKNKILPNKYKIPDINFKPSDQNPGMLSKAIESNMGKKYEESDEPTFSLHDFKKWLQNQGNDPDEVVESTEDFHKKEMKDKFKKNFKSKREKN